MCALLTCSMPVFAQDWCEGMVTDKDSRVVARLAKPAARQSYTDPSFGTRVTRVTNAPAGTAHRTLYNTIQPWNADESLLLLYHTGDENAGHHLYDGQTYRYIRQLEFSAADIEGMYWDESDSSKLYFVQKRPTNDALFGKLVRYDVNTRTRSLVADLDLACGSPASRNGKIARGGNDIQGLAGNLIGLRCVHNEANGNTSDLTFHVNVRTGKIGPRLVIDPAKAKGSNTFGMRPDVALSTLHSGRRVVVQDNVFDVNMNFLYRIDSSLDRYRTSNGTQYSVPKLEHSTIGRMPNGHDAIFSPRFNPQDMGCENDSDFGRGAIVAHDLQSNSCRVMVGRSTGWGYPLRGVHLSSVSSQNPGWVAMTSIGYGNLDYLRNGKPAPLLFSELSLTHADPDNPTTCRLAHTRTTGKSASRGGSYRGAYFGEPHAVMSPSGSRILFNSDWYDSGSVDTYAVHLESGGRDALTPAPEVAAVVAPSPEVAAPVMPEPEVAATATPEPKVTAPVTPKPVVTVFATSDSEPRNPQTAGSENTLQALVRMQETYPRVYIDFADNNPGSRNRITIARAGSPDNHLKMWLYTNGTHNGSLPGPESGRVGFLQAYIGTGRFEARLFTDGNFDRAVHRITFTVPDENSPRAATSGPAVDAPITNSDTTSSKTTNSDTTSSKTTNSDNTKSDTKNPSDSDYGLRTQVRMQESPPRVYVDFTDMDQGAGNRVKIARAGSPDNQHVMWLYTNATQRIGGQGPQSGRLGFLQQYVGSGNFEARFFTDDNLNQAVQRVAFSIP